MIEAYKLYYHKSVKTQNPPDKGGVMGGVYLSLILPHGDLGIDFFD